MITPWAMFHRASLVLVGVALVAIGVIERGWVLLAIWPGCNFLIYGVAHVFGIHRIFGKKSDGTIPFWSWLLFLPLSLYTRAVWRIACWCSREPASGAVAPDLVVGRRLLPSEVEGKFVNYIDLTAEFPEPLAIRQLDAYQCFPILDASAPDLKTLHEAVSRLRPGRTFIHCAQGHGRTGLFALSVMLNRGTAQTIEEGLEKLKAVRPGINLTKLQWKCIQNFAATLQNKQTQHDSD